MIRSVNELRVTLWTLAFATIGVSGAPASRAAGASTAWTAGAGGAIGVGAVVATTVAPAPGEAQARLADLRRAVQEIGRIVAQLAAAIAIGHRALDDGAARKADGDHFLPAGPRGEVLVAITQLLDRAAPGSGERRPEQDRHLQRRQLADPRREHHFGGPHVERQALAIDLQHQSLLQGLSRVAQIAGDAGLGGIGGNLARLKLLKRRNLRHVDEVSKGDRVVPDVDTGVLADTEVAERMRRPWLRIRQHEDCEKAEHPDDPSVVHDLLQALRATSEFGFSS